MIHSFLKELLRPSHDGRGRIFHFLNRKIPVSLYVKRHTKGRGFLKRNSVVPPNFYIETQRVLCSHRLMTPCGRHRLSRGYGGFRTSTCAEAILPLDMLGATSAQSSL